MRKVSGTLRNRRGNFPGTEKKPPRLPLDAPELLESPDPALKAAAEIAQQEKLKMQKIKAVKFLLSIGCACYDKDGKITAAVVAKSDDCTEEVRLVTMQELKAASERQCCSNCGSTCCCNETIIKRLAEMAYHRDETGCFIEPSERVREAAAEALVACCPDTSPVIEDYPTEEIAPPPVDQRQREGGDDEGPVREGGEGDELDDDLELPDNLLEQDEISAANRTFPGKVIHLDVQRKAAHLHFNNLRRPIPVGTELRVQVIGSDNTSRPGRLRVYQTFPDSVNVTAVDDASLAAMEVGAIIESVSAWEVPVVDKRVTRQPRVAQSRLVDPQLRRAENVANLAPVAPVVKSGAPAPVITKEASYRSSSRRNWSKNSMVSLRTLLNSTMDD
jgi:hypothetical protein